MIRLAFALITSLALTHCAMPQYSPVESAKVVAAPGWKQKPLFQKSRQWFSEYFVSGESVVDYEDVEAGTIIGKGIGTIGSDPLGIIQYRIHYTVRIDTKDGRLRVTTKIIKHTNTDHQRTYDVGHVPKGREDKAIRHMAEIVNNIEKYVTSGAQSASSDW